MSSSWTLAARWIFPVSSPPLENGLLTIAGEHIASVEPRGLRRADVELGDAAILPGLVNAHTHLDLAGLRGLAPFMGDFTAWLGSVIAHRRRRTPEQIEQDVSAGLAESRKHGVTLLADVAGEGRSWSLLARAPVRAVVFYELLGLSRLRASQAWAAALDWLRAHPATRSCRPGLSPHAPYSVRTSLLRAGAALASSRSLPLMIHLAETREELELLEHRRGPFVPFLQGLGVWDPEGLAESVPAILQTVEAAPHLLVAHGNYLPAELVSRAGTSVVYCPRTHSFFAHAPHAFQDWLSRGVRVVLGTDSLASGPDLDVLAEAAFLHYRHPQLAGATLLRMATLSGAEALGWAEETGSLEPGKSADLVVLPLRTTRADDPHDLLWDAAAQQGRRVLFQGQWQEEEGK